MWRLRVVSGYDPRSGNPRQLSRTFRGTKKGAESALAAFLVEVDTSGGLAHATTTVAAFLDRWLDHIEPSRSPTTIRGYRDKSKRIEAELGTVKMGKLSAQQLDRAYRKWQDDGLSPNTVHHIHAVLSAALHQAVKWDVVTRAVTEQASPPLLRITSKQALDVSVVPRLVAAADETQPVLSAAIAVAATTRVRRGELLGVQWPDVDLDGGILYVRRAVKHGLEHRQVVVGDTKTHQTRRLALDPFTVAVLMKHRERSRQWAADAQVDIASKGFVFTLDPSGTEAMRPDSLGHAFGRLAKQVGVDISLHDLRHFAATTMLAAGVDVRTVAGRLGHADPAVTLKVYSSFVQERDRHAAGLLGELVSGSP